MIPFTKYAKIKDNYCVAYLGLCNEYLLLLNYFVPKLEVLYPGINIYLCCRDEYLPILTHPRSFPISLLKQKKEELVYVKEIVYDGNGHPIETFLIQSGLTISPVPIATPVRTTRAVILTKGNFPTNNLNTQETEWLMLKSKEMGFTPELDVPVDNAGYVLGVECYEMYRAGFAGIKTALVNNGVGTEFYKKLFLDTDILEMAGYIKSKTGKVPNNLRG
jgi:hypothetical protein